MITVKLPDRLLERFTPRDDAVPDAPVTHRQHVENRLAQKENRKARNRAANRVARRSRRKNR